MKSLTVMLATVLAVAVIVVVPALAQDAPNVQDTQVSGVPGDGLVKGEEPPPTLPPPAPPPSDTPLPDTPPAAPLLDIGEKTGERDSVYRGVEDRKANSDPVQEPDVQEVGRNQTRQEVEEQEIEDREIGISGIGKAGLGKAGVGKDEEDKEDEDGKAGDPKQETKQDADSGDVDQSVDVINTGDNVNLCLGVLQAANTGNAQNAGGLVQDDSEADEIELEGGSRITLTPQLIVDCRQIIYQIITGQRNAGDNVAGVRSARNLPGLGQLNLGLNRAALKSVGTSNLGLSKAAAPRSRSLPRTGGGALLGLGAGVVLISGGLLVRRIFQ
jgi:hypothetical protein